MRNFVWNTIQWAIVVAALTVAVILIPEASGAVRFFVLVAIGLGCCSFADALSPLIGGKG